MGSRASITVRCGDGLVDCAHVHWAADGSHWPLALRTLNAEYGTADAAAALVAMGDQRALGDPYEPRRPPQRLGEAAWREGYRCEGRARFLWDDELGRWLGWAPDGTPVPHITVTALGHPGLLDQNIDGMIYNLRRLSEAEIYHPRALFGRAMSPDDGEDEDDD